MKEKMRIIHSILRTLYSTPVLLGAYVLIYQLYQFILTEPKPPSCKAQWTLPPSMDARIDRVLVVSSVVSTF